MVGAFFHWIAAASFVKRLRARCGRCCKFPASADFRRGYCQDFNLDKMVRLHAAVGSGCALDTTHAGGPLVRPGRSRAHQDEYVVWSCIQRTGSLTLPQARAHEATGTWWMGTGFVERRYERSRRSCTTPPWPPPGHHSGGMCRFPVVLAARQCAGHLHHGIPERASVLDERPGVQHPRAVHLCVNLVTDLGAHRRDQVEWAKGHATMQHVRAGTTSLWQLQANELADEQAKKGSALHPSVTQIEQSYNARASFLAWLAKFLGRLRANVKWCSNASRDGESRTPSVRAFTRWRRRASFGSAGAVLHRRTGERGLRDGVAESCRAGVVYSKSSRMAETQKTDAGWQSYPGMRWAGRPRSR